jgi:small subunit ribosomal protein S9
MLDKIHNNSSSLNNQKVNNMTTVSTAHNINKFYATGRRKTATARVWLKKGTGKFIVNSKNMEEYFGRSTLRTMLAQPFAATSTVGEYDIFCTVKGSGPSGQAGAIKHGISRALDSANPVLHAALRNNGLLTRDSREVERKKYGRRKARRRFQFCKR